MPSDQEIPCPNCEKTLKLSEVQASEECKYCHTVLEVEYTEEEPSKQQKQLNKEKKMEVAQEVQQTKTTKTVEKPAPKKLKAGPDHEAALQATREKFNGMDVQENVHDTYSSWYKNKEDGSRGRRFMVVYRYGRYIKVQFFAGVQPNGIKEARPLSYNKPGDFEVKVKTNEEFEELLNKVF